MLKRFLIQAKFEGFYEVFLLDLATGLHRGELMALENGMDVKTLSAMLGHVSAATTLDIYTHITDDMRLAAAANIDRGIGKAAPQEDASEPGQEKLPQPRWKSRV